MTPGQRWSVSDRTDEAADGIAVALEVGQFSHYAHVAGELPQLLSRHGLGQTMAYFVMRSGGRENSPYELVYRQMARRLAQLYPLAAQDLLTSLTRIDSQQYLRMAEEARLFALALHGEVEAQEYAPYGEEET